MNAGDCITETLDEIKRLRLNDKHAGEFLAIAARELVDGVGGMPDDACCLFFAICGVVEGVGGPGLGGFAGWGITDPAGLFPSFKTAFDELRADVAILAGA